MSESLKWCHRAPDKPCPEVERCLLMSGAVVNAVSTIGDATGEEPLNIAISLHYGLEILEDSLGVRLDARTDADCRTTVCASDALVPGRFDTDEVTPDEIAYGLGILIGETVEATQDRIRNYQAQAFSAKLSGLGLPQPGI